MDAHVPTSEQLMAELSWVRKLARVLVRDDAVADDVAQEAWLVAAEQRPDDDRPLRPWLARVVVNLVRTRRRSDARRGERDAAFDGDRDVPTPAELVERVQLQRAVAGEVLALTEPYRSTVLLHFVEGYSSAQIARKLGIPDGTVRRRLKVALDQLREALRKRTDQPRQGWLAALVPFAGARPARAAIGGIAMKKVLVVVVVLVLLLAIGGGLLWRHHARSDGSAGGAFASGRIALGSSSSEGGARGESDADRLAGATVPAWLVQAGVAPRRIAGRVVSHGVPVGGAKVVLALGVTGEPTAVMAVGGSMVVLQPIAEVAAGADGAFDFGVQPPANFVVSASAAKYAAGKVDVANADPRAKTDQLVVELADCGSRLFGTIADASGGGIAKARISTTGFSGTEADGSGKYSLCLTPRHSLGSPNTEVRVEADGYGTIRQDVIVVGDLPHDFLLVPEASLAGRVVTSDGKPVTGARVVAGASPEEIVNHTASGWAMSDRDGRFRIAGLAPGTFRLTATAQDAGTTTPVVVVARPTTTSREIELVVATLARVRGHVFMDGKPVANVSVNALPGFDPAGGGASLADGSFEIGGVAYGVTRFLAAPYQVVAPKEVTIDRAIVDGVRIELSKLASVRGHVTRHGQPVAGADVLYMPPPQAQFFGGLLAARTDASGAFVIEGLPVGPGRIVAWDAPGKTYSDWKDVDITATEDETVDIALACSGEVKGTVVDEAGNAVAGAYVRLDNGVDDQCESMTNATGQFDCALLVGGAYHPSVSPLPGGRQSLAPATGDTFAIVNVPKDGIVTGLRLAVKNERVAIRGMVVDDKGALVPDVHVAAIGPGASSMDPPSAMSDAQGRFAIGNLARGTYALRAHAADGSDTLVSDIIAGSDSTKITLARAGAIEGTLAGFSSSPNIQIFGVGAELRGGLGFAEGTRFSKTGLPPGRYTLLAKAGLDTDGQLVEIHAGETLHVSLQRRELGTVEGTVTDAAHKPLGRLRCDAQIVLDGVVGFGPPDEPFQAYTDAAGHFSVRAPVGRVRLFCFSPSGGPHPPATADVDVTSGPAVKVTLTSGGQ